MRPTVRLSLLTALLAATFACGSPTPEELLSELHISYSEGEFRTVAGEGNIEAVNLFLESGMDPDVADDYGFTALMKATQEGEVECAGALIDAGANVNAKMNDGMTVLMLASREEHGEIVRLLLENDANPSRQDSYGNSVLMHAAQKGDLETARILLDHGANPNLATLESGATALGLAAAGGHVELTRLLLEKGAEIEAREKVGGQSALGAAALEDHGEVVKILLEHGADALTPGKHGNTPLEVAAISGSANATRAMLEAGVDPSYSANGETSALMLAALKGHSEVCKLLIDYGADVNARTAKGYTAYFAAKDEGHLDIISMIQKAGGTPYGTETREWETVSSGGTVYPVPAGWKAIDPFTNRTSYWKDLALLAGWSGEESYSVRRALLQSDDPQGGQIFLVIADSIEVFMQLAPRIGGLEDLPLDNPVEGQVTSADGVRFDYLTGRLPAGVHGKNDVTHLISVVDRGSKVVMIDAGGLTGKFEPGTILSWIEKLELGV